MSRELLRLENFSVEVGNRKVIKSVDLTIKKGEVHVIFGPNGGGKSTLIAGIMGLPGYSTEGKIFFEGKDISKLPVGERAKAGIAMAFQNPPEVKGVVLRDFLKTLLSRKIDEPFVSEKLSRIIDSLRLENLTERELNVGFSGGEKKRAEVAQVMAQGAKLLLLDEIESGVDLENVVYIGKALAEYLELGKPYPEREKGALVITHTGKVLEFLMADIGHVLIDGEIVCSGSPMEILKDITTGGFARCRRCASPMQMGKD